jgi:hypothetical protein
MNDDDDYLSDEQACLILILMIDIGFCRERESSKCRAQRRLEQDVGRENNVGYCSFRSLISIRWENQKVGTERATCFPPR